MTGGGERGGADGGPAPRRPLTLAERRRLQPPRVARALLRLAVLQLPAAQRRRYALEFLAELHELPRRKQTGYTLALAANALRLRAAVSGAPAPVLEVAAAPRRRRHLSCWLLVHRFVELRNEEGGVYTECRHCGRYTVSPERGNSMLPPPL